MALGALPRKKFPLFFKHRVDQLFTGTYLNLPEKIITDWRRFSSGHWRVPEGDIAAAYSAESFPKVKTFVNAGVTYANCGASFSKNPIRSSVDAYPLIVPGTARIPEKMQYSYQGELVKFEKREFHLGTKVVFESSEPTISEWRSLLRVFYADGGLFAAQETFRLFLEGYASDSGNLGEAARVELHEQTAALNKLQMVELLVLPTRQNIQLDLF